MITAEQRAVLERQIAYFRSDERIRDEVAPWRDSTPEERLAELAAMCRTSLHFTEQHSPEVQERAMWREPLADDTIALLEAMKRA
jgi:hypothetical protein